MITNFSKHVVVAMSGGVDSSAAAALLLEQGYLVTGMILRFWSGSKIGIAHISDSINSASAVADKLRIPFQVIDAEESFYENVVQYFVREYTEGKTPNPCILCNRLLKWGLFLEQALVLGADFMATGHYAVTQKDNKGSAHLFRSKDLSKDQSYVLSVLSQEQLQKTLFPLGEITKAEARLVAKKYHLPVSDRPESQDLCFIEDTGYQDFLSRYSPDSFQPGNIITKDGKIIGKHAGLAAYTIGQRKGIRVANTEPYFVIEKNIQNNTLIVGREVECKTDTFKIVNFNWILGQPVAEEFVADVMIRYRAKPIPSNIQVISKSHLLVKLSIPLRDISPGQLAVVYHGDEVIGGGFIQQEVKE